MDVFKFLDEAVRGTVAFVYGFARSTLTLIVHPIRGPARLWAACRDPSARQISPITYLALSLALMSLLGATARDAASQALPGVPDLARFLTTGSLSAGLIPTLAGAIVGTIVIDALLRLIGRSRLKGARHERFVAIVEYGFGLFVILGMSSIIIVTNFASSALQGWLGFIPYYAAAAVLALHFYSLLTRSSRYYARARNLPRRLRAARKAGVGAWLRHSSLLLRRPSRIAYAAAADIGRLLVGLLSLVPLMLTMGLGSYAGGTTSAWLAEQQAPRASVTLLNLRCDLARTPGTVGAAAWNNSGRPAIGWLDHLVIEIRSRRGRNRPLEWRPVLDSPQRPDLLMPGEVVQVRGTIPGSAAAAADARHRWNPRCVATSRSDTVGISSEGNAVRLPPAPVTMR